MDLTSNGDEGDSWQAGKKTKRHKSARQVRKDLPKRQQNARTCQDHFETFAENGLEYHEVQEGVEGCDDGSGTRLLNSSRVARSAKRRAVKTILEAAFTAATPLTPEELQALAGALRASGYKSAHTYIAEAKIYHIERGWEWSSLLDRHFKLCTKAVKRGMGPAKNAPEVPEETWKAHPLLPDANSKTARAKLAPLCLHAGSSG